MQVIRHNRYPAHNLSDIERAISMASGAGSPGMDSAAAPPWATSWLSPAAN